MTQSLNTRLLHWQHLRHIGEWILIAGLGLELLHIAFVEWLEVKLPAHVLSGKLKAIGNVFCTLLIVVGVVWESVAGGNADEVIRQMRAPRFLSDTPTTRNLGRIKIVSWYAGHICYAIWI